MHAAPHGQNKNPKQNKPEKLGGQGNFTGKATFEQKTIGKKRKSTRGNPIK